MGWYTACGCGGGGSAPSDVKEAFELDEGVPRSAVEPADRRRPQTAAAAAAAASVEAAGLDPADIQRVRHGTIMLFRKQSETVPESQLDFLADDRNVGRYLIARKGVVDKAAAMLFTTIKWRDANEMNGTGTPEPDYGNNCFVPVGLDRERSIVFYSNHARTLEPDAEKTFLHTFRVFEACISDDDDISRVVWIMDFNGFGFKHCSTRQVSIACDWFGNHFPERLGQIVLLSPPKIFQAMWSFVVRTMDAESARKIQILQTDEEMRTYFAEHFSPETGRWLLATSKTDPANGYPTGTDLSLIPRTKWEGPPVVSVSGADGELAAVTRNPSFAAGPPVLSPPPLPPPAEEPDECTPSTFFDLPWLNKPR